MPQKKATTKKAASNPASAKANGYGKRPYWQWIVLYLLIGGLLYWIFYMIFFGDTGGYNY